jgi:hypothetical protein
MSETGPTGTTGTTGPIDISSLFPSAATGFVDPPHIATIEELMSSHAAVLSKEAADKETLNALKTDALRDLMRPALFQWAAQGFPDMWVVERFTVDMPAVCSDGISRSVYDYFEYCLGTTLSSVLIELQSKLVGIRASYSFQDKTLRIHVSRS